MTRLYLDDLVAAQAKLKANEALAKGRTTADLEDVPTGLLPLIGLWLLLTGLIVLSVVATVLRLMTRAYEEISDAYARRPRSKPKPKPRATSRRRR